MMPVGSAADKACRKKVGRSAATAANEIEAIITLHGKSFTKPSRT